MSDRQQVYSMMENARKQLMAAIDGLKPEQMTVPVVGDWSVKDLLTHVSSWEEYTLPDYRRLAHGQVPALACFHEADVDQWNVLMMALRRNFPLDQALQEMGHYRQASIAALDALPEEAFAQGQMARILATIAAGHDLQHTADIRQWRQREGL